MKLRWVFVLAMHSMGCATRYEVITEADQGAVADAEGRSAGNSKSSLTSGLRHAASGYVDVEGSPVVPWCQATYLGVNSTGNPVALTSSRCANDLDGHEIKVGFGEVGQNATIKVIGVEEMGDGLAALYLLRKPRQVAAPAIGTMDKPATEECNVSTAAYGYGNRHDLPARMDVSGCAEEHTLKPQEALTSCLTTSGGGIFIGERLVGVVTAVNSTRGETCQSSLHFADVQAIARELGITTG